MTSVLFDIPGPRARVRHRVYTGVTTLLLAGVAAWVLWQLWQTEQITPEKWEFLGEPRIVNALLEGLVDTLTAAAVAIALALVFGAVFAAMRLSERPLIRWPAVVVIEFFRAIPLLLMIVVLFYAFPDLLNRYWSLVFALMLYNGSVLAEVFRAGVQAVPRGQREAGFAIGLTGGQVLRSVLAPQAVRAMLPAIISQCVVALKDTTLGIAISAPGIVEVAGRIYVGPLYRNPFAVAVLLAAVFIVINYALSRFAIFLERRLSGRSGGASEGAFERHNMDGGQAM